MDDREQKLRERAHRIWEEEGRVEGSHEEHWRRAEQEHDELDKARGNEAENFAAPSSKPKPDASSDRRPSKAANAT